MSATGLFLLLFLANHFVINVISVFDTIIGDQEAIDSGHTMFDQASHFMATNPMVQIMQPVLAIGFLVHIIFAIMLTFENKKARDVKYAVNNAGANSSFASRYMIYTGFMVLAFIILHLKDFFWKIKFTPNFGGYGTDYKLLMHEFSETSHIIIYTAAFILLAVHLWHGFQSAFQSLGLNHSKYTPLIKTVGVLYSIAIPAGFAFIAIFQYISQI